MERLIRSHSEADTIRIARDLAADLPQGGTVLLFGQLGAGKTAFVRGLLAGAGGDAADVTSPTFTLIQQYAGRLPVTHVDLYRLSALEADDLGLDEIVAGGGIVAIEWADRLARPLNGAVQVHIEDDGADTRSIRIERT